MFVVASNTVYDLIPLLGTGFDGPVNQEIPAALGGVLVIRVIDRYGLSVSQRLGALGRGPGRRTGALRRAVHQHLTDSNGLAYRHGGARSDRRAQEFSATVAGTDFRLYGECAHRAGDHCRRHRGWRQFTAGRAVAPGSIVSIFGTNLADTAGGALRSSLFRWGLTTWLSVSTSLRPASACRPISTM